MTQRDFNLVLYGCLMFSAILSIGQVISSLIRGEWAWAGMFTVMLAVTLPIVISVRRRTEEPK